MVMVDRKVSIPGVAGPLPNDRFMAYKWGATKYLLTGMIHEVVFLRPMVSCRWSPLVAEENNSLARGSKRAMFTEAESSDWSIYFSTNRSNPEINGGVPISVTCSVWYEVMTLRDITKIWTESRSDSRQTSVSYQVTMLAPLGSMGKVANNSQIQKLSFTTYISRVPQRHKHILYHELLIIFGQQIGTKPKHSNMGW